MHSPLLVVVAVLTSMPSLADVYFSRDDFHYALSRRSVTAATDGDLHVSAGGVNAKYGVRRESRIGAFQAREVAVLGEAYELKDAEGGQWRMWIRTCVGSALVVELVPPLEGSRGPRQLFHAVEVTINGAEASPTFAQLELLAGGLYRLGTAHGHYLLDEGGLALDGFPAQWGRGVFAVDGHGITFRFKRGPARWEVKYERNPVLAER